MSKYISKYAVSFTDEHENIDGDLGTKMNVFTLCVKEEERGIMVHLNFLIFLSLL